MDDGKRIFKNFFSYAPPHNILETIFNTHMKVLPKTTIDKIVNVLDETLDLSVGKIGSAFLSKSGLSSITDNIVFASIRNQLDHCIQQNNCSGVAQYINLLGKIKTVYCKRLC